MKIDGKFLSRFRFADDILICDNTPHELQELADESDNQSLNKNKSKIKVMMKTDSPIYVHNTQIENVEIDIYLGPRYSTRDKNLDKDIQRRITAGWTTFTKHRDIFKGNIGTYILPAMRYGHILNKSVDGSELVQGTSAGYEIADGHCLSPHGNSKKPEFTFVAVWVVLKFV